MSNDNLGATMTPIITQDVLVLAEGVLFDVQGAERIGYVQTRDAL
jgi:hypothetical protein